MDLAKFHGTVFIIFLVGSYTDFHKKIPTFPLFRPEYHCRDLGSRNAHLVHQNLYRISFPFGSGLE
jgi:hypothetical protein